MSAIAISTFARRSVPAGTVVTMYDPSKLQVRADVRLEDVPRVRQGQPVRIETAALPDGLDGEVLQVTSTVDIQKNTLQVKVSVKDPPPNLKPEMIVKVTFLSVADKGTKAAATDPLRVFVPRSVVESDAGGSYVWIADQAEGVARRRTVTVGTASGNNLIEVHGLTAADKIIVGGRDSLSDGQRINVTGEDYGAR
jgi:multidrug efflux pump subunit AcrA (membrane-fusion protein)